ncbi:hypothetical protein [Dissulfurispira sp.]|uniref:hypothetical protein n=1 Tax=Dissulfurispira sp. TaxID=2817609 RepID=UPI002FDA2FA6
METIRGVASKVRNTIDVSGGDVTTTTHICIFQLDGRTVKVKSSEPPIINEGDNVIVAGNSSGGVFYAFAYRNLTSHTEGNEGYFLMFLFGVIFPVASVMIFSTFSNPFFGILPKIIASVFLLAGLYMLFRGIRVLQAVKLLKES